MTKIREPSTNVSRPTTSVPGPGLTTAEAEHRLRELGPNTVADASTPVWRSFLAKFWSPVPWMLEAAIVLQLGLEAYVEAAVIGGLLLLNATLGVVQEARAGVALTALKRGLAPTALVCRDGQWVRLPASGLVPDDAITLSLGAIVPADARIVSGSITVDQSMLTGESVAVEASAGNQVYAGSLVRRGQAMADVTATGSRTHFGRAAELVRVAHAASTEQAAIVGATRSLAIVNGAFAVLLIAYAYAVALPSGDVTRFALTALLATIPVALPATFALSAALGAHALARHGVLVTRLSAAHEAAAMDVLCVDKTGTLTRNRIEVIAVVPVAGFDRPRVLALAALASSDADQDPIDAAIRAAATADGHPVAERVVRFEPFDPATQRSAALVVDQGGHELRVIKGALHALAQLMEPPAEVRHTADDLGGKGHRVIAVAVGATSLRLAGLIALSDPPREDAAELIATLEDLHVRAVMVTGDSATTAAAIARAVGITGAVCLLDHATDARDTDACGVFARVLPEEKYRLVQTLQHQGHVVGMCGDGTNDAPALRQAQLGIAVAASTDVAKAAAGMVLTEPGLSGIVWAIREGRIAFQRLLGYTLNMFVKKIEIVLFLVIGLVLTGHAVLTPVLMVLMMVTNDFLSMSLTTDRADASPRPSVWRMKTVTAAAAAIGLCKLTFSTSVLGFGIHRFGLGPLEAQTLAFVTLVFGNQAVLFVLRERRHLWRSRPSSWVLASSSANVAIVSWLASAGILMAPLPWRLIGTAGTAAFGFAVALDYLKRPIAGLFTIE